MWPFARPHVQIAWKRLGGLTRQVVVPLGILLLGLGIGGVIASGQYTVWTVAPNTGRIIWNFEQTASGRGYFLNLQKWPIEGMRIIGFGAHGKNNSAEPINDFGGYMRSDVTNETFPLYLVAAVSDAPNICTPAANTAPKDTLGIPGFADFDIVSFEKPLFVNVLHEGPSLTKFLSTFVPFTIVMQYDGKTYQRRFSREEVDRQVALFETASGPITNPHVVRKSSLPPPPPPPLTTLIPPQASPVPPRLLPSKPLTPDNDVTGKIQGK
ncbi:MAG TPA: hypothetical protein VNU65_09330 [Xanthobacteraceae bacterium]|nr:hypothetical protein [Xanthobacteraceae bacterium]